MSDGKNSKSAIDNDAPLIDNERLRQIIEAEGLDEAKMREEVSSSIDGTSFSDGDEDEYDDDVIFDVTDMSEGTNVGCVADDAAAAESKNENVKDVAAVGEVKDSVSTCGRNNAGNESKTSAVVSKVNVGENNAAKLKASDTSTEAVDEKVEEIKISRDCIGIGKTDTVDGHDTNIKQQSCEEITVKEDMDNDNTSVKGDALRMETEEGNEDINTSVDVKSLSRSPECNITEADCADDNKEIRMKVEDSSETNCEVSSDNRECDNKEICMKIEDSSERNCEVAAIDNQEICEKIQDSSEMSHENVANRNQEARVKTEGSSDTNCEVTSSDNQEVCEKIEGSSETKVVASDNQEICGKIEDSNETNCDVVASDSQEICVKVEGSSETNCEVVASGNHEVCAKIEGSSETKCKVVARDNQKICVENEGSSEVNCDVVASDCQEICVKMEDSSEANCEVVASESTLVNSLSADIDKTEMLEVANKSPYHDKKNVKHNSESDDGSKDSYGKISSGKSDDCEDVIIRHAEPSMDDDREISLEKDRVEKLQTCDENDMEVDDEGVSGSNYKENLVHTNNENNMEIDGNEVSKSNCVRNLDLTSERMDDDDNDNDDDGENHIEIEPSVKLPSNSVDGELYDSDPRDILRSSTISAAVNAKHGTFFHGCRPLCTPQDDSMLNEFDCLIRKDLIEVCSSSIEDVKRFFSATGKYGRPHAEGQIAIRCKYCKGDNTDEASIVPTTSRTGIFFPFSIRSLRNQSLVLAKYHVDDCDKMPVELKTKILSYSDRDNSKSRTGRREFWTKSAKAIGMDDSPYGIVFRKDPTTTLLHEEEECLEKSKQCGPTVEEQNNDGKDGTNEVVRTTPPDTPYGNNVNKNTMLSNCEPLVFDEEKPLIADYLFAVMQQMRRVVLRESDRIGCYRLREKGFPGLACKWCIGQAGSGRYFPASEASLSQTTTSQTILNHIRMCSRCPSNIREEIDSMVRLSPKKKDKPKHGGRKVFFHRLWCRIQGIPDETLESVQTPTEKKTMGKAAANEILRGLEYAYENAHEEKEISASDCYEGCIPLNASDDDIALDEKLCHIRKKCVVAVSATADDVKSNPALLLKQVGMECVYCKMRVYPSSIKDMHLLIKNWQKVHFSGGCDSIPKEILAEIKKKSFTKKSGINFDPKRYWKDAAREIGLVDTKVGIFFGRDPTGKSPADILANPMEELDSKDTLVSAEERLSIPDSIFLLLKQGRRCTLTHADQSSGVSDQRLDFAGICCKHCDGKRDDVYVGRFFPSTKKSIIENFATSFYVHVLSCPACPSDVKNSLRYLECRACIQENQLGKHWRKRFFAKTLWNKLHSVEENKITGSPSHWQSRAQDDDVSISGNSDVGGNVNSNIVRVAAEWLLFRQRQASSSLMAKGKKSSTSAAAKVVKRKRKLGN